MTRLKVNSEYAGYTENVIVNCLWDAEAELKDYLKTGTYGSAKHVELSERVKNLSTLACASN